MSPEVAAALAARERPAPEPDTIRRLRTIKPGEHVIYYSGNDVNFVGGPAAYRDMMERIVGFARGLALAGRVDLLEERRTVTARGSSLTITDYIAIGKARGREFV